MPNWACGTIKVTGTKENIKNFFNKRFIFSYEKNEELRTIPGTRYFARSFYEADRKSLEREFEEQLKDIGNDEDCEFSNTIDFAWSAHSCIVEGYPDKYPDEYITLKDACIEDHVAVEIDTEECGMGFEEHITCDDKGNLVDECEDMKTYRCKTCGNEQMIPSQNDLENEECCECDSSDWELVE